MVEQEAFNFEVVGSNPTRPTNGLKVFMDARQPVTLEEWGSLPPETAKKYLTMLNIDSIIVK